MLSQRNINAVNDFDTFETTEDRLTFLIHIPIHAGCGNKPATEKTTVITTEKSAIGSEKNGSGSEKSSEKTTVITTKKTTEKIVRLMKANPYITNKELAEVCGITEDGVYWNTKKLKKNNRIRRIGGDKGGYWEVLLKIYSDTMPAIITDSFDYDDIVRVLDLDEAFVHHQIDALQPKYWRIVIKTKPKGLKIFAPVMVSGNRGIDYLIYMLSRDWQCN